jgi:hypothetical protein
MATLAFPEGFFSTKAIVKIVGLVPATNTTHASLWSAFTANQAALSYQLSSIDQLFPPRKPKVLHLTNALITQGRTAHRADGG